MSKRNIIIIILVVTVLAGVGGGIFFTVRFINGQRSQIENFEDEIDLLEWQLLAYGQAVDVYVIRPGAEIRHGTVFRLDDIEVMVLPESMVTDQFITNPLFLGGAIYRVDVEPGTPLIWDLFTFEEISPTHRYYDIVADVFPIEPHVGQYYDLRIVMPRGQDYIVLSKKRVVNFYNSAIRIMLDQEEIHQYQSALVDTFINPGTYLYVTTYVEPNMQKAATPYYPVGSFVMQIMELDPNIVKLAEQDITLRRRAIFEAGLSGCTKTPEEITGQIVAGRSEQVSRLTTAAQNVLQQREQEAAAERAAEEGRDSQVQNNNNNSTTNDSPSNLMSNTFNNPMINPNGNQGNSGSPFIDGGN